MYKAIIFAAFLFAAHTVFGQSAGTVKILIKNKDTNAAIGEATASIAGAGLTGVSNSDGRVEIKDVPPGEYEVEISSPGYEPVKIRVKVPDDTEHLVLLELNNEVGSVTITSTRTGREIEAEPTRVEAIDEEEIDEKISMRPGNVSMVLHESTGIQVQQTSATSNTQTVRIQGLDGRYTQILKDGFPAYGGFSGSLSVLDIPPLDLKQVEVIKGPSATLFGGDAIAGVVNFVSKDPEEKLVTTLILNQTSALGSDVSLFNSQKYKRFGYTILGSANYQKAYDVDDDDFTELPRTIAFGFTPKLLFYLDENTTLTIGNSSSFQDRKGGDVVVLRGEANAFHRYFEQNRSFRNITTAAFTKDLESGGRFMAKQSFAVFDRKLTTPDHRFGGQQMNSFTDVSFAKAFGKHAIVFGGSMVFDRFKESPFNGFSARNETRFAAGAFVQDTVDLTDKLSLEAGFRLDGTKDYGAFALPRVSLLYRFTGELSSRASFGVGYKTPTMFTEEAETLLFRNVDGIGNRLKAERSTGGTFDLNYNKSFGEAFSVSINQMFFYTKITDPLVLRPDLGGTYLFANSDASVVSRGIETNARLGYGLAKLFVGYTFTDATAGYLSGDRRLTLMPRHKVNSSLVFEKHESFKAGVEFYYGSRQVLEDRSLTRSTAEIGLFGEKTFGNISVFINAENLTDVRQGRYTPVVLPPHSDPSFAEIYTHTEGRIFNGGVKLRF